MSGSDDTLSQLLELFNQSRKRGEWVSLSLETKDGKDCMTFSMRHPAGPPARNDMRWSPASAKKWKTPSQLRRDQKRKQEFLAKKKASLDDLDEEKIVERDNSEVKETPLAEPKDEIELTEMSESNLYRIVGEYKNPKFKPWTVIDPEAEVKQLWELLKKENDYNEMEEIGEGSTCFEHHFEFWGVWRVKPGTSKNF